MTAELYNAIRKQRWIAVTGWDPPLDVREVETQIP